MRFSSAVRILTCSPVLASCMAFRDCRAVLKAARVAEKSASIFDSVRLLCGNAIVAERQSGQTLDGTDRRATKKQNPTRKRGAGLRHEACNKRSEHDRPNGNAMQADY